MMTVEELYSLGDISEIGYIIMRLRFDYDSKYGSFGCFTNIMNKINQFTPEIVDYSYNSLHTYDGVVKCCIKMNELYIDNDEECNILHYPLKFTEYTYEEMINGKLFSRVEQERVMEDFFNSKKYLELLKSCIKSGEVNKDNIVRNSNHIFYRTNWTSEDLKYIGMEDDLDYEFLSTIEDTLESIERVKERLLEYKDTEIEYEHSLESFKDIRSLLSNLRMKINDTMTVCERKKIECFDRDKNREILREKYNKDLEIKIDDQGPVF